MTRPPRISWQRRLGYAIVFLFALSLLLAGANLLWTAHEVNQSGRAQAREQAAQRRQGQVLERRLCTTLGQLASLRPPAGNPASNPSRAYEDAMHKTLSQVGPDIGCPS